MAGIDLVTLNATIRRNVIDIVEIIRETAGVGENAMKRRLLFIILLIIVLAMILKYGVNAATVAYVLPHDPAALQPS